MKQAEVEDSLKTRETGEILWGSNETDFPLTYASASLETLSCTEELLGRAYVTVWIWSRVLLRNSIHAELISSGKK